MPPAPPPGQFLRNLGTVVTGTAAAQALALAAVPLLTRLYDPAALGAFALLGALAGIAATVAAGRWELAGCCRRTTTRPAWSSWRRWRCWC